MHENNEALEVTDHLCPTETLALGSSSPPCALWKGAWDPQTLHDYAGLLELHRPRVPPAGPAELWRAFCPPPCPLMAVLTMQPVKLVSAGPDPSPELSRTPSPVPIASGLH